MPDLKASGETPFLTDVATLRERARQHIQAGAVTSNYGADPQLVCKVLNEALGEGGGSGRRAMPHQTTPF